MQVDQQGRRPADHVRAGAAAGQLEQMRKVRQFADDEARRLVPVMVRKRAHTRWPRRRPTGTPRHPSPGELVHHQAYKPRDVPAGVVNVVIPMLTVRSMVAEPMTLVPS